MPLKKWKMPQTDEAGADALAKAGGASPLVSRVLWARGLRAPSEAASFLAAGGTLHDPFLMKDMDLAVAAIENAMAQGELIVIYGDYDCDGMTSTVLLYRYLEEAGARVAYYIPDREEEGYGLNRGACDALAQSGAGLVITVDNGITALEEVAYLQQLGVPVVVTDHHQPREELPVCAAVLNPHRADDGYPFKELAGVGVAFKLVCALEGDGECMETLRRYGDIVCVGTIADVVALTGENRVIAAIGLRCLRETENPGLQALMAAAGIKTEDALNAQSVSFGIAPRLNAASRMGHCDASVELLLCEDPKAAASLAAEVDADNRTRKSLEGGIMEDIERQLSADPTFEDDRVLVLSGEGWHHGVVGIVASRVVERWGRPCLLIGTAGEEARGSARSVEGFSVIDAITACAPLLEKFGGHTMAAGFSLRTADIPALRARMNEAAARTHADMPVPCTSIDAVLRPEELELPVIASLGALEPYGAGNEAPLFALMGVKVEEVVPLSEGRHLRLRMTAGARTHFAVYFGMSPQRFPYGAGDMVDLAASVSISEYNGQKRLSIQIKDIRPAHFQQEAYFQELLCCERLRRGNAPSAEEARRMIPAREQTARLYRAIRSGGALPEDPDYLYLRFCRDVLSCAQARIALTALLQAGLVGAKEGRLTVLPTEKKVNLEETPVMLCLREAAGNA